MEKILSLLTFVVVPFIILYGAKLPDVGYSGGPYQFDMGYGDIIDLIDDEEGGYYWITAGTTPMVGYNCPGISEGSNMVYVCTKCLEVFPPSFFDDPNAPTCEELQDAFGVFGKPYEAGYLQCSVDNCNSSGHIDDESCTGPHPPLGCPPVPAGAETPLFFFAFSYLALSVWRRKKNETAKNQISEKQL